MTTILISIWPWRKPKRKLIWMWIQSLLKSLLVAETPNSKRASFDRKWILFFTILKIAEIDNPAVNELLNFHNIRVDEEFLHVFYDILCRRTKQKMYVILTKHTKILPRGKNISLIIWVKCRRQRCNSKTLVRVRHRMIPAPLTLFSNRIRKDLCCEAHFACDFWTALEILAFTLE